MLCCAMADQNLKLIFLIGEHLNGHYIYAVSSLDAETLKKYHSFTEKKQSYPKDFHHSLIQSTGIQI